MLFLILISISLSIDAFSVGVTYGFRKIMINIYQKIIISCISAFITFLSLVVGTEISKIINNNLNKLFGFTILFFMGIYLIFESYKAKKNNTIIANDKVDIPKEQNKMKPYESILIGITLSIDSFGSGIGLSILGFNNFLLPLLVALCQYVFLSVGIYIGKKILTINKNICEDKFLFLSGIILILVGITRFF
jgi:putative sporulation protein YtaF